jgi:LacI family transcriptional regulator
LEHVAELSGFEHPEYMSVLFKRETGQTPGQYRKQLGVSSSSTCCPNK